MGRSVKDRVRHALLFEVIGIAILIVGGTLLTNTRPGDMGVIGLLSATIATVWNYVFNYFFDKSLFAIRKSYKKSIPDRFIHVVLFELGLIVFVLPMISYYLDISLLSALLMDIGIVCFYLFYSFFYNIVYDKVFPIKTVVTQT